MEDDPVPHGSRSVLAARPIGSGGSRRPAAGARCVPLLALILALGPAVPGSSPAETSHQPVNLSLFYPVSTNRTPDVSTNLRLNLIYGRLAAVRGLDLTAGVSILGEELRGVQLTGIYSHLKGGFVGLQAAGAGNFVQGEGQGVQLAGLFNYDRGEFVGLQSAGIMNFTESGFRGVQASSVLNAADGPSRYAQLSVIANTTVGEFLGGQVAGFFNYAGDEITGFQLSTLNYGTTVSGAQVGLVNIAGEAAGAQVGFINLAKRMDGVAVGAVNLAENGAVDGVAFASNLMGINAGVRTVVNGFYSMFTVGGWDLQGTRDYAYSLTWNYGRAFPLRPGLDLDADLGLVHIIPVTSDDPAENDRLHPALQARALLERRMSPVLSVFAGGGVSVVFSEYSSRATSEVEPLFVAGISVY